MSSDAYPGITDRNYRYRCHHDSRLLHTQHPAAKVCNGKFAKQVLQTVVDDFEGEVVLQEKMVHRMPRSKVRISSADGEGDVNGQNFAYVEYVAPGDAATAEAAPD